MARREYPPEVIAQAMAMVMAGTSMSATARHFGVSVDTIRRWKERPEMLEVRQVVSQEIVERKAVSVGALVTQYLAANLGALTVQAEHFADPEWIQAQSATDLVAVHRALGDRAIQILGALQPPEPDPEGFPAAPYHRGPTIDVEPIDP